jgi:hypothetical protein
MVTLSVATGIPGTAVAREGINPRRLLPISSLGTGQVFGASELIRVFVLLAAA